MALEYLLFLDTRSSAVDIHNALMTTGVFELAEPYFHFQCSEAEGLQVQVSSLKGSLLPTRHFMLEGEEGDIGVFPRMKVFFVVDKSDTDTGMASLVRGVAEILRSVDGDALLISNTAAEHPLLYRHDDELWLTSDPFVSIWENEQNALADLLGMEYEFAHLAATDNS